MALPLPKVVSDVGPGGPLVTSMQGMNALTQGNAQARYAPYTAYADAASKIAYANMLPYQIQAQVMSNPMLFYAYKDHPEMLQGMMNSLMKSVPQGGNVFGNVNMPSPGGSGMGNGLLGTLLGKMGIGGQGGSSGSNAMNQPMGGMQQPSGSQGFGANNQASPYEVNQIANYGNNSAGGGQTPSALLPGTQGGIPGLIAKNTIAGTVSPEAPGALMPDPNDPNRAISVPTSKSQTAIQQQLLGEKRAEPQLERLASEWSDFMDIPGMAKLGVVKGGNMLGISRNDLKAHGINDPDSYSKYAKAQATLKATPEAMIKAYGLNSTNETLERLQDIIAPQWGENKEGYKNRLRQQISELKSEQVSPSEQALSSGYNIPNVSSTPSQASQAPNNQDGFDVKKILDYKYSNADEFKQAMSSLNSKNRQLVMDEMKRRGWH